MKKRLTMLTPITIDKESVRALGLVAAYFSVVENYVHLIIWNLLELGSSDEGLAITGRMDALRAIELLQRVANVKVTEQSKLDAISAFANEFDSVRVARNKLLHAQWVGYNLNKRTAIAVSYTANKKVTPDVRHYTSDDIHDVAQDILQSIESGRTLINLLFGEDLPGNFAFRQ